MFCVAFFWLQRARGNVRLDLSSYHGILRIIWLRSCEKGLHHINIHIIDVVGYE